MPDGGGSHDEAGALLTIEPEEGILAGAVVGTRLHISNIDKCKLASEAVGSEARRQRWIRD